MTHRFPLQEAVFPPLQLLTTAQEKYVKTAQVQLTRALHDYDRYHKWQSSRPPSLRYQLHPAMWKPVKTCEQLTVYRRVPMDDAIVTAPKGIRRRARSRTLEAARIDAQGQDSVSSAPKESTADYWPWVPNRGSVPTINGDWTMPTLLQVGTIEGTLDDVMYGSVTFTAADTLIKAIYTSNEIVDADTLYEIQGPTNDEPFRFLGLKWAVKATSPAVKAFVWPRDLVYLEATGILDRQGGERVGYHLMHSLDLGKGFDSLEGKRIVRGRVSSCYLYRQTAPNTVEVYMKTNFEPNGSVHESVAVMSAANSLTYCLRSALCAQNKKLSWLLSHPRNDEAAVGSSRQSTIRVRKRNDCGVCTRPLSAFSKVSSCRICSSRACSSCRVKKKLSFPGKFHKAIEHRSVVVCTHCLTHARRLNTFEIAQQELTERGHMNRRQIAVSHTGGVSGQSTRRTRSRSNSRVNSRRDTPATDARSRGQSSARAQSQRKVEATTPAPSDYNCDEEDNNEKSNNAQASTKSAPTRVERQQVLSRNASDNRNLVKKLASPIQSKSDAAIPVASDRPTWDLDSDAEEEDDYDRSVVSSRALSLDPECAGTVDEALPEAVVQYAWGEVVPSPSPSHRKSLTSSAPWPSPPSSPLQSPVNLPTESEVTWPASEGERATVWTAPAMPQIRRINVGASTQEVLAQFAELCNAAESAYQTTRKHTITHIDPILEPSQRTTRFDMSAVD